MKIADLIDNCVENTEQEYDLLVSGEESVRDVLLMMHEKGCQYVGIDVHEDGPAAVLTKDELLGILLEELEGSYEKVAGLNEQISLNFDNQSRIIEDKLKGLIVNENNKLSVAVDYMQEGLIILDTNNNVERANPSAKEFLTLTTECDIREINDELNKIGFLSLLINEPTHKDHDWGEYRYKNSNNRVLQIRWSSISTASELPLGKVVLLKDITDEQADEKAKTEFIAAITHELRTPLTIIQNSVSNILAGVTGSINKKTKQYLDTILVDCHRFGGLISDLLDMSKIETGKMAINRSAVNVSAIIDGAIQTVQNAAGERNISFVRKIDKYVPALCIDRDRICQVIVNLLSNAIKHTEENGSVIIRVNDGAGDVVISVEDRGPGIAPGMQKQIFNKFHQIGRQAGAGYKGAGLGLAICNGIMEMHGGSIWVESEPGLGSKFYISLPKTDVMMVLNKCIKELSEKSDKSGSQFGLLTVEFKSVGSQTAGDQVIANTVRRLIEIADVYLDLKSDVAFEISETEIFFVVSDSRKIASVQKNVCRIISDTAAGLLGKTFVFRIGTAVYPSDTKEILEMANVARLKSADML